MDSVYSVGQKSLGNGLQWARIFSILGIFSRWGELPSASQHPTSHHLPRATSVLDITSETCSPWILSTALARNPPRCDSSVGKQIPPQAIFPHWGLPSQHATGHPLPLATPVLDITSRTCSPWILCTLFARNPLGMDSNGRKSFPSWGFSHIGGNFPLHLSTPFATLCHQQPQYRI